MPPVPFVERTDLSPGVGSHDPAGRCREIIDPPLLSDLINLKLGRGNEIETSKTVDSDFEELRMPSVVILQECDCIVVQPRRRIQRRGLRVATMRKADVVEGPQGRWRRTGVKPHDNVNMQLMKDRLLAHRGQRAR